MSSLPWTFPGLHPTLPSCDAVAVATVPWLTLHQRACYYGNRLVSPAGLAHAAFSSGFAQWRNTPHLRSEDADEFGRRLAMFYARKGARNAGEFLAGYLNREDPRPRLSNKSGIWNRTASALRGVMVTTDESGVARPALSPIAGALASGFVGAGYYRYHNSLLREGFQQTGIGYGAYFSSALVREFKPDLTALGIRLLRKKSLSSMLP